MSKLSERENEAEGRPPAPVRMPHSGSDPDRKKRRSPVPPVSSSEVGSPEHDPIMASYDALDQLLVFLIERAKGDDNYDLIAIREGLHGGSI